MIAEQYFYYPIIEMSMVTGGFGHTIVCVISIERITFQYEMRLVVQPCTLRGNLNWEYLENAARYGAQMTGFISALV